MRSSSFDMRACNVFHIRSESSTKIDVQNILFYLCVFEHILEFAVLTQPPNRIPSHEWNTSFCAWSEVHGNIAWRSSPKGLHAWIMLKKIHACEKIRKSLYIPVCIFLFLTSSSDMHFPSASHARTRTHSTVRYKITFLACQPEQWATLALCVRVHAGRLWTVHTINITCASMRMCKYVDTTHEQAKYLRILY